MAAGGDVTHSKAACNKAKKLLTEYTRLYAKTGRELPAARRKSLDAKRDAGTISKDDLPASLKRDFPGEFSSMTLAEVQAACQDNPQEPYTGQRERNDR